MNFGPVDPRNDATYGPRTWVHMNGILASGVFELRLDGVRAPANSWSGNSTRRMQSWAAFRGDSARDDADSPLSEIR